MPRLGLLQRSQQAGVASLDAFLLNTCHGTRLLEAELHSYASRKPIAGWEFVAQPASELRRLRVLLDARFPYSLPKIFLADPLPFPSWPHVEPDGNLCLLSSVRVLRPDQPEAILGVLLGQAFDLIRAGELGLNQEDFRTEFYSYWNYSLTERIEEVESLLKPEGPSRLVHVWPGKVNTIVGESTQDVLTWLRKRFGNQEQFDKTILGCLLWLPEVLLPSQYPTTARDFLRLAQTAKGGKDTLERLSRVKQHAYYILFGAQGVNGPCFGAAYSRPPLVFDVHGRRRNQSMRGFRNGKIPQFLKASRLFSSQSPATRLEVERVDANWIHGRGHDPHQPILAQKHVIVIGCGSVGAPIAELLVKSGIGSVALVDPETLTRPNTARHPLGSDNVGKNKAQAMASRLQTSYPHLTIRGFPLSYEEFASYHPEELENADLIVSATANWTSESLLNAQRIAGEFVAPIVFSWTEPHACAGHAVCICSADACLQCGMHLDGRVKEPITCWPDAQAGTITEPACGAVFQPYGVIEIQGTITMASELVIDALLCKPSAALHRVWQARRALVESSGGSWNPDWTKGDAAREAGGLQTEVGWEKDHLCPACSSRNTGAASITESEIRSSTLSSPRQSSTT